MAKYDKERIVCQAGIGIPLGNCKNSVLVQYTGKVGELKMIPQKNVIIKTDRIVRNIDAAIAKGQYSESQKNTALLAKSKLIAA